MLRRSWIAILLSLAASFSALSAQDSRGSITGRVLDPQQAIVPGSQVTVTSVSTGAASRAETNHNGYFEVNLLIPGAYHIDVEAPGFKKLKRDGIDLSVGARLDLELILQVGQMTETVQVTAEAPLLDTTTASGGRVIDNRQIMQLPMSDLNPLLLAGLAPGMQSTGNPVYRRPFDNGSISGFNTSGAVGSNEYTIDGAPNTGGRNVAFVPPVDAVEEFRMETTTFDASYGHTTGATVNVMTKAGTNQYHGTAYFQHWQQRLNATNHFRRLQWENGVRAGTISPDTPKQPAGRQHYYGGSIGGPVQIPKLVPSKDKLFFFFSYMGLRQMQTETSSLVNNTVPKMAWREGDFSDMLALDSRRYTIYDPRSARLENGRVVRTPFPGNKGIPVLNPMYKFYEPLYPQPNNVPGLVSAEGFNNYLAFMPAIDHFSSMVNRIDYNLSDRHRIFGRWYGNWRQGDDRDWMYETARGVQSTGIIRRNLGVGLDYVWTLSGNTVLNATANWGRYSEGESPDVKTAARYKPSDVGLPEYLDQKAGEFHRLPGLDFNNITDVDSQYPYISNRATTGEAKALLSTVKGNHSIRIGWQERRYWSTRGAPGNSSGNFVFRNTFDRATDVDNVSSSHALDWASFMMATPASVSIATNDSAYWTTPWRSFYFHDDLRLSNRVRLGIGLRYEYEGGTRERFNRGIAGGFDYNQKLTFSDLVEAAYAARPLTELAASQFQVRGAASYLGNRYDTFTDGVHWLLPRLSGVVQLNPKMVLRLGYGDFADFFNGFISTPSQRGYSQDTSTPISNDNGLTFCCGVGSSGNLTSGRNIMSDPFPIRANGTRFDVPYGNSLGADILGGIGISLPPRNYRPALQHRWRVSLQRQFGRDILLDVSYNGAYSTLPLNQRIDYLPGQYWATGNTRNQANDDALNTQVPNPYSINNLAALQTTNPNLYNYLSTQSFFTAATVAKNRLLRPFSNLNGSTGLRPNTDLDSANGRSRYHDLQLQLEKRFSRGFSSSLMYTFTNSTRSDWYANEFDSAPTYTPASGIAPHRLLWTTIWELPFGKGRRFVSQHRIQHLIGGWNLSWIYQRQSGSPTSWGNVFFYGDTSKLEQLFNRSEVHSKDIHVWFDPSIAYRGTGAIPSNFEGFEGRSAMQPGTFHVRSFPNLLEALRTDGFRQWDVKVQRAFAIREFGRLRISADFLNATNRTNFEGPNTNPTNADFGRVTAQRGLPRQIQFTARLEF
jgi:hypothetical protein